MNAREIMINDGKKTFTIPGKDITSIRTNSDTFTWNKAKQQFDSAKVLAEKARLARIAAEAKRSGQVKFINKTGQKVEVIVTGLRDSEGNDLILESGVSKSNLEVLAEAFSSSKSPGSKRWSLDGFETAYLKDADGRLKTSKLWYTLKTSDGTKSWSVEKKSQGSDFVVTIETADLHSPVLAKIGPWTVEQDISYTTHRGRTNTVITREKEFFGGKDYFVVHEGQDYEYDKEVRGGTATAYATIENPTSQTLVVEIILEFHFTHLILSNEQVTIKFSIEPNTRMKAFAHVDTKAVFGNRKATSVRVVDVSTVPN